jgi:hypothetical protein
MLAASGIRKYFAFSKEFDSLQVTLFALTIASLLRFSQMIVWFRPSSEAKDLYRAKKEIMKIIQ